MFKRVLIIVAAIILLGIIPFYLFFPGVKTIDGARSGTVFRISQHQLPFKTYEGELSLGLNEVGGDGAVVARIFYFSVANPEIFAKLEQADRDGKRVTLHYREYMWRGRFYGKTNTDIVGVE